MTVEPATTADSDSWTGAEQQDESWRTRCCLCLFFPAFSEMVLAIGSMMLIAFVGFWIVSDSLQSYMRMMKVISVKKVT